MTNRRVKTYWMIAAAFIILFAIIALTPLKVNAQVSTDGKIYIENMDVTDMSEEEIQAVIDDKMAKYKSNTIQIFIGEDVMEVTAGELGLYYANTNLAHTIASIGMNGDVLTRYKMENYLSENGAAFFALDLRVSPEVVNDVASNRCTLLNRAPSDMHIERDGDVVTKFAAKNGYNIITDSTANVITEYMNTSWHGGLGGVTAVIEETAAKGISEEYLDTYAAPMGYSHTLYQVIDTTLQRCENIKVATSKINGTILYPGEVFSTEQMLIPFVEENGYKAAPSYENGEVVDSIGGGVCQVSSTLYRAVLEAELEVVERYPHSMIVGYVDPSMDATIAEGSMDFKFMNNTDSVIYIEGWTGGEGEGGYVCFQIYGHETRPPERELAFESEVLSRTEPQKVLVFDANVPFGIVEFVYPHEGMSARAFKIVKENGVEVSREQISYSDYYKSDAKYKIGMAGAPANAQAALQPCVNSNDLEMAYGVIDQLLNGIEPSTLQGQTSPTPGATNTSGTTGNTAGTTTPGTSTGTTTNR